MQATLRVLVASLVGIVLVATLYIPHGQWIMITIFTVSLADAGSSLRKVGQRILGTLLGGGLAIASIAAFADRPWFILPLLPAGVFAGLFLNRTTTAPYTFFLAALTFVILLPAGGEPQATIDEALWRVVAIVVGGVLAAGAQLLLWPVDPQDRLRAAFVQRLRAAALLLAGAAPASARAAETTLAVGSGVLLDMLASAEARHPRFRRRHAAMLSLVTGNDRLASAVRWLMRLAPDPQAAAARAALATRTAGIANAMEARLPPPPASVVAVDVGAPAERTALTDVDDALARIEEAATRLHVAAADPAPLPNPGILTPATTLANGPAVRLAFKGALGATVCMLLVQGLGWPEISTSVLTCPIVALPIFAEARLKAFLRISGGIVGGLMGLLVIVGTMPYLDSLAGLLVVTAPPIALAAWLVVGSPNVAYAGIQVAMAFALCALVSFAPTTELTAGRDRVLGILIGVAVMAAIDRALWPLNALADLRVELAHALRHLAALTGNLSARDVATHARAAQDSLATAARFHTQADVDPGAAGRADERARLTALATAAEDGLLGVLALARHPAASEDDPGPAIAARLRAVAEVLSPTHAATSTPPRAEPAPAEQVAMRRASAAALEPALRALERAAVGLSASAADRRAGAPAVAT